MPKCLKINLLFSRIKEIENFLILKSKIGVYSDFAENLTLKIISQIKNWSVMIWYEIML